MFKLWKTYCNPTITASGIIGLQMECIFVKFQTIFIKLLLKTSLQVEVTSNIQTTCYWQTQPNYSLTKKAVNSNSDSATDVLVMR